MRQANNKSPQDVLRILAIADVHGVLSVYEWLGQLVRHHRADLLILAGDLFAGGWEGDQREQARNIISLLKSAAAPCFYLMGNDDNVGLEYTDEQIKPLHGRRLPCGTYSFVGYEYTPPFVGEVFVKPDAEIGKDLRSLEPLLDEHSVFITHAPAFGVLDHSYGGEHVGSRSLAALLDRRPVLAHIHGHIHESFGRDNNRFNVAAAGRRRGVLIELPSLDHKVLQAD